MSTASTGIERISKILLEIDKSHHELQNSIERHRRRLSKWPLRLAIASILLVIVWFFILLAFDMGFIHPAIRIVTHFSILSLATISYFMLVLNQLGLIGPNRRSVRGHSPNSFEVVLRNVKLTADVDFQYVPELMNSNIHDLENTLLEVKTEREFMERRLVLFIGAIDKVGILPGVIAFPSLFKDISTWNWVSFLALGVPVIYVLALYGNNLLMRLDRMIKLLELSIQRKMAEGGS